ncbi:MAG: T9SS type A sorting domain-containing protein [Jejuia sp.]
MDENSNYYVNAQTLNRTPIAGDTIFVDSSRKFPLRFQQIEGDSLSPIVVINKGGQVKINDTISNTWGAITFENCKYIKISGAGHPGYKYGFELAAVQCGLAFTELSSDCEAEFIKINHDGFFGILAKKDYNGSPPNPIPVFKNLNIHDCFIENVSEGMYLGETTTPGMEFKHVKLYNNIIRNTQRESIQIANMVEDIKIYNNTMINAGTEGATYHMNILQIGDNSVASIYNNIMLTTPVFGINNMGKGDVSIINNYIASSQGIFCDNRTVSDSLAPIHIQDNFFRSITGNHILRNMNEYNYFTANDNNYDTNVTFYLDQTNVDNDTIFNNTLTTVTEIQFTDPSNNDYSLAVGMPSEYLSLGAPGGPEFFQYQDPTTIPQQLVITADMVIDSVQGGSVNTPLFLFDEQYLDVEADERAVSVAWKPDVVMNESSYHAIVDLGNEYHISELNLHDYQNIYDFTVEYYDGTEWVTLFTEPCNAFNVWKTHLTDISTRYLRFSMYENVFAEINEVIVHGYPLIKESSQIIVDSTMVTDLVNGGSVFPPTNLFDEQNIDYESNLHPSSESWKPYFNDTNAPYYTIIDLGQDYYISEINMHDINSVGDFDVEYGDDTSWTLLLTEPCDAFNVWKTHETDVVTRYLRLSMPSSPYAAINEIIINGYPIMTIASSEPDTDPEPTLEQIIVTSGMVTDLVSGGSVFSPQYLFDEQNIDPLVNEIPVSNEWKPYFNANNAPYYTTVDLGAEYHISKVYMYDVSNMQDFNVEYDDNGSWSTLFVEPCDAFNSWKEHIVDVDTQHLRLGMLDSPYAAVNEIIVFGYPTSSSSKQNSKKKDIETIQRQDKTMLFPNPAKEKLHVKFSSEILGYNTIEIIDVLGKSIFQKKINIEKRDYVLNLDLKQILPSSGLYLLKSTSSSGYQEVIRFLKE